MMDTVFSVSDLNEVIKKLLEECFETIWIEGEIANLVRPASGHIYFTLKDESSQIHAVMFRRANTFGRAAGFNCEDGLKVLCRARLSIYRPHGKYQLIVETMEPRGVGALQVALEQLKAKLLQQGLFDESKKKPLPYLPQRIAVITSPTGAVIRDILTVSARRFPSVNILVVPVRVQGLEAPAEIVKALHDVQTLKDIGVVILARGGGSLEDLSAFNSESVARAIFACKIPVVSAIGHETDFTISDFVADMRASTPSVAAELVIPERDRLVSDVKELHESLYYFQVAMLANFRAKLNDLRERNREPQRRLDDMQLAFDDRVSRMQIAIFSRLTLAKEVQARLLSLVADLNPSRKIHMDRFVVNSALLSLKSSWKFTWGKHNGRVSALASLMESVNPLTVLKRGYSITKRLPTCEVITDNRKLSIDDEIEVKMFKGSINARVSRIIEE